MKRAPRATGLADSDVFMALASATHRLGRSVNPTLLTQEELATGLAAKKRLFCPRDGAAESQGAGRRA